MERCPEGVVPACHNNKNTVTISGDAQAVHEFVKQLKEEEKFAKLVDTDSVAFHSHHMLKVAPNLKKYLSQVRLFMPPISHEYQSTVVGLTSSEHRFNPSRLGNEEGPFLV